MTEEIDEHRQNMDLAALSVGKRGGKEARGDQARRNDRLMKRVLSLLRRRRNGRGSGRPDVLASSAADFPDSTL